MAERTSTRIGSRRTTPQPVPSNARVATSQSPQKRATRATRSQSRDISDSDTGRRSALPTRAAKQVASEGTDSAIGKSGAKGRKGGPAISIRPLQDLTTVPEDPHVVYPEIQFARDDEGDQNLDIRECLPEANPQNSKSPGGASAFSGTTLRISLPAQDSADLNSEGMLEALPDLSEAANKLLGCLMPAELSEATITTKMTNLHTKGTTASINWRRHGNAFQAQREVFGSDSYISPSAALKQLLGTKQLPDAISGHRRPHALFQKANLAVLASSIFSRPWQEQKDQFIEELEQAFPGSFTEALVSSDTLMPGHSMLVKETFQIALDVRTQHAITLLARCSTQPNFDFDVLLHQIFYKNEDELKGWGIAGLHSEDLTREVEYAVVERLKQLRKAFTPSTSGGAITGVEHLRRTFAWTSFVYQTVDWIGQRLKELEAQISSTGGIQAICQGLNDEVHRLRPVKMSTNDGIVLNCEPPSEASDNSSEQQNLDPKPSLLELGQFNAASPKSKKAAAALKRRISGFRSSKLPEQREQTLVDDVAEPASDIQVASTAEPSARALTPRRKAKEPLIPSSAPTKIHNNDWQPQVADDEGDERSLIPDAEREKRMERVLAERDRHERESNKENIAESQIQPSTGRKRLIDRQEDATRVTWESQESGSNANASQEDSDDNDEFQRQHPTATAASRRNLKPSNKRAAIEPPRRQGPSPKKVRIQEATGARTQCVAGDRQLSVPPASQVDEYMAANAAAKERKTWQVKPPQVRKGWTEEETDRLLDLIHEHGTSWALLKNEDLLAGNILAARDQVALKDKARNMKLDFLKASAYLPRNFHRIPLSKLQIDKLKGLDIKYDPETGIREDAEDEE